MIKQLRTLLCLLLVVIMPLCFVACKSGKTPDNDGSGGGSSGGGESGGGSSGGSGGGSEPGNPPINYVLDTEEINRVLESSYDVCKDFIIDLNDSNLLKNNNYGSNEGTKTEPILEFAFYPARFVKSHSTDFEKSKVYALQPLNQQTTLKHFKVDASETNDKIYVTITINTINDLTAYFYEYSVSNGNIDSLRLSYVKAGYGSSSSLDFAEVEFNFKNSVFEVGYGKLLEVSSRTYLDTKFDSKEHFSAISSGKWSYSHYHKFNFSGAGAITKNKNLMPNNEELIKQFDKFGFVDAFDKLDALNQVPNNQKINLNNNDYFAEVAMYGLIDYDSTNCIFEIIEGE